MRGFILTTKGDLKSKIDYTFRIYDQNGDNQISGEEIQKMANVISNPNEKKVSNKIFIIYLGNHANVRWRCQRQ
jgi:Ca2+-binding EF-hand superfamily protein